MDAHSEFGKTTLFLENYDDQNAGYLRISADTKHLRIGFHEAKRSSILRSRDDLVTVDIATHEIVAD